LGKNNRLFKFSSQWSSSGSDKGTASLYYESQPVNVL
jgi:hypothetical protein